MERFKGFFLKIAILIAAYFAAAHYIPSFESLTQNVFYMAYGYIKLIPQYPVVWAIIGIIFVVKVIQHRSAFDLRRAFLKSSPHGQAVWADWPYLNGLGMLRAGGLFLGEIPRFNFFLLRRFGRSDLYDNKDEGHFLTIAAPGGGKSTSLVIPALLSPTRGSFVISDPKGELTAVTRRHRESISKVVYLNPFFRDFEKQTELTFPDSGFNPFDAIVDDENLSASASNFACHLMVTDRRDAASYFKDDGAELLALFIVWMVRYEVAENKNLAYLYTLVRKNPLQIFDFMEHTNDPIVIFEATRFKDMFRDSSGQWAGVLSKCHLATKRYVPTSPLAVHTTKSGFDPQWLKQEDVTVYILIPTKHMKTATPWLNMLFGVLGTAIGEIGKARPVTFLMDELPALGFLPDLRNHMRMYRSAGLRMWLFSQTIAALTDPDLYGQNGFDDLAGICSTKQFFNIGELKTAREISAMCGETSEVKQSTNSKDDNQSDTTVGVPLVRPEELLQMDAKKQIIIRSGRPILANLVPYYTRPEWRKITDANPYREK